VGTAWQARIIRSGHLQCYINKHTPTQCERAPTLCNVNPRRLCIAIEKCRARANIFRRECDRTSICCCDVVCSRSLYVIWIIGDILVRSVNCHCADAAQYSTHNAEKAVDKGVHKRREWTFVLAQPHNVDGIPDN